MTRKHRTIATCLLFLVGLTGCLNTINAVLEANPIRTTTGEGKPGLFARIPVAKSQWQQADGALDNLDRYLAQTGHYMIRVHRQQGPPVVLHQVQMASDTLYGAYFDEGIPLADVVAVDVPLPPPPLGFEWRAIPVAIVVIGGFMALTWDGPFGR